MFDTYHSSHVQDVQKGRRSHPPSPGVPRRAVPRARPQRAKGRGGTFQTSLEPLASITCERIATLAPLSSVEPSERRENAAGRLFQHPAGTVPTDSVIIHPCASGIARRERSPLSCQDRTGRRAGCSASIFLSYSVPRRQKALRCSPPAKRIPSPCSSRKAPPHMSDRPWRFSRPLSRHKFFPRKAAAKPIASSSP